MTMEIGKRYVVTKPSDDGTFEAGDCICLHQDGTVGSFTAHGWIPAEEVPASTKGMEVAIDQAWVARRKEALRQELAELEGGVQ